MPSRRSHTNSHHGCTECRAGRVKCDETKPRCSRCQARGRTCTYRHLQSDYNPFRTVVITGKPTTTRTVAKEVAPEQSKKICLHPPADDVPVQKQVDGSARALYEHYLEAISPMMTTQCSKWEILSVWDEGVKRHAATQGHLQAIMLAFSAAHLALSSTEEHERKQYLAIALEHQTEASALFYPILNNPSADNYESGLVCASLIVLCAFATALITPIAIRAQQQYPFDVLEELTRILALFEGMTQFFKMSYREDLTISAHVRDQIFGYRQREMPAPEAERELDELDKHIKQEEGLAGSVLYLNATMHMRNVFRRLAADPGNQSVVMLWPSAVWHVTFLRRLEEREPVALILVAYWGVCLHNVRQYFWIGDWGSRVVASVHAVLDEQWQRYLVWPLSQVQPAGGKSASGKAPIVA